MISNSGPWQSRQGTLEKSNTAQQTGSIVRGHLSAFTGKLIPAAILLLFMISVICRIPFLLRPLTGEHDWLTLHTMLTVRLWDHVGLSNTHYGLPFTYPNPADKFVCDWGVIDSEGMAYFVSFPPFAFYLAYLAHIIAPSTDMRLLLKGINLLFLLFAAFALTSILKRIAGQSGTKLILAAIMMFFFNRAILMSLGNLYFSIIISVPIWIIAVSWYLKLAESDTSSIKAQIALFVLIAILCYTDWLGFLAAATFCAHSLLGHERRVQLAKVSAASALLTGVVIFVQYSRMAGAGALAARLMQRLQTRVGLVHLPGGDLTIWNPETYRRIYSNYVGQFKYIIIALIALAVVRAMFPGVRQGVARIWRIASGPIICFFIPIALDTSLLLNHTATHDYAVLKAAPFLVLMLVVLWKLLAELESEYTGLRIRQSVALAIAIVFSCLAVHHYLLEVNVLQPSEAVLGETIKSTADLSEVVFLIRENTVDPVTPNLFYFAGRNVKLVHNEEESQNFLRQHGRCCGILFRAEPNGALSELPRHLRIPN
jgi:hypothetical protein